MVDLLNDDLRTPMADTGAGERCIDAAKTAFVRTTEARLDGHVAAIIGNTPGGLPVVCAVQGHIEQIPGLRWQLCVEVLNFARPVVYLDLAAVPVRKPWH